MHLKHANTHRNNNNFKNNDDANSHDKDFHRNIIVATLYEKARVKYIKRGGRNLRNEDGVLDLLEEI